MKFPKRSNSENHLYMVYFPKENGVLKMHTRSLENLLLQTRSELKAKEFVNTK